MNQIISYHNTIVHEHPVFLEFSLQINLAAYQYEIEHSLCSLDLRGSENRTQKPGSC